MVLLWKPFFWMLSVKKRKKTRNTCFMFSFIRKLFSTGASADFAELMAEGAQIIDVRTKGEFQGGHLKRAVNIPLQQLQQQMGKIRKDSPVIVCCASGARSAAAARLLKSNGFSEVYNGGGWTSLRKFEK
jgi:rhodanese-related sulfurtransferase